MTDEEARRILAEHGELDVPERGKLRGDLRALAQQYADAAAPPPGGDTPEDVTGAAEPPAAAVQAERAPRRTRTPAGTVSGRLRRGRGGKGGKGRARKPAHPRVPVDRLTGMIWEGFGRLLTPISLPTARTVQLEAPIAGQILEDIVRDTAGDRLLQPLARNLEKGRKAYALFGPPMIVMALEVAAQLPPEQRAVREAFLVPMLLESLMAWDDVAGDKLEETMARAEHDGPRRERAQRIMQMIFTPPVPPDGGPPPAPGAEDEAAARAQQMAGAGM